MPSKSKMRPPRWYAIPVRVLLVTFIGTLIAFALSLFFGIAGLLVVAALRHGRADMRIAYLNIALPSAIVAGCILFVLALGTEIRHYRQTRALAAIERVS